VPSNKVPSFGFELRRQNKVTGIIEVATLSEFKILCSSSSKINLPQKMCAQTHTIYSTYGSPFSY